MKADHPARGCLKIIRTSPTGRSGARNGQIHGTSRQSVRHNVHPGCTVHLRTHTPQEASCPGQHKVDSVVSYPQLPIQTKFDGRYGGGVPPPNPHPRVPLPTPFVPCSMTQGRLL